MKTLVAFYSRTGNNKKVAEFLAKNMNADLDEIIDKKGRKGTLAFISSGRDAMKKSLTDIEQGKDPAKYDRVFLGAPVWAGTMTPAMRSYLILNKEKLKEVGFFSCCGGEDHKKTFKEMEAFLGKKAFAAFGISKKEVQEGKLEIKGKEFLGMLK